MTVAEIPLARPAPFRGHLSLPRYLARMRESMISAWPEEAFEQEIFERRLPGRRVFVVNAPDFIRHILVDNAENYVKSQLARRMLRPGLGDGLLTAEGEAWRRQRRLLAPVFQPRAIAGFAPTISRIAGVWERCWAAEPDRIVDMTQEMSRLTLEIITRLMISDEHAEDLTAIGEAADRYQREARPHPFDLIGIPDRVPRPGVDRRARAIFREADARIHALIARRRREGGTGTDLLGLLMAAGDTPGERLSDGEIRDQLATIFLAGHETTANALVWVWYLLDRHEAAAERLADELRRVIGDRAPTLEDIDRLPWTRLVLSEALRLYPPAHAMTRQALAADRLGDVVLPAGAVVVISPWLLHRHRRLWNDPEVFRPERFEPSGEASRPRYGYLPFGAGPRICIGAGLAMTEATIVLASLAQRWRPRLISPETVEPVGKITLRPRDGMKMRLAARAVG